MAKSTIVNLNDVPNEETPLAMKEADEIITGKVKSKPTNHSPRR